MEACSIPDCSETIYTNRRYGADSYEYEHKLKWLRGLADTVIAKLPASRVAIAREEFNSRKYKRNPECWLCHNPSECRHHMVQLQNGGSNDPYNIIPLCNECHAQIHPWLGKSKKRVKLVPSNSRKEKTGSTKYVFITEDLMNAGMSFRGGWSTKQFHCLGSKGKGKKGWKKALIGKRVSMKMALKFISLRKTHDKSNKKLSENQAWLVAKKLENNPWVEVLS